MPRQALCDEGSDRRSSRVRLSGDVSQGDTKGARVAGGEGVRVCLCAYAWAHFILLSYRRNNAILFASVPIRNSFSVSLASLAWVPRGVVAAGLPCVFSRIPPYSRVLELELGD